MNYLKKIGVSIGYMIGILLISLFIMTLLNYFGVFGPKVMSFFKIAILIASLFIGGWINGKRSLHDGWLEGLKLSGIVLLLFMLLSLLFFGIHFTLKTAIFYLIIIGVTTFGSMIGINQKSEK